MPFCTYCGQSFTRDEHLERHILTRETFHSLSVSVHQGDANYDGAFRHKCQTIQMLDMSYELREKARRSLSLTMILANLAFTGTCYNAIMSFTARMQIKSLS